MESALLVSGSEKGLQQLKPLLEHLSGLQVVPVASGSEARRRLAREEYALAVINGPLQEELGQELALWIAEGTACGVVLLLRREEAEELAPRLEEAGVLVLGKPLNVQALASGLHLVLAAQRRLQRLQEQNRQLQDKLEETRLVCRAKCVLVERRGMSEQEAHRFIEKQAMNHRITRRQVARELLQE